MLRSWDAPLSSGPLHGSVSGAPCLDGPSFPRIPRGGALPFTAGLRPGEACKRPQTSALPLALSNSRPERRTNSPMPQPAASVTPLAPLRTPAAAAARPAWNPRLPSLRQSLYSCLQKACQLIVPFQLGSLHGPVQCCANPAESLPGRGHGLGASLEVQRRVSMPARDRNSLRWLVTKYC